MIGACSLFLALAAPAPQQVDLPLTTLSQPASVSTESPSVALRLELREPEGHKGPLEVVILTPARAGTAAWRLVSSEHAFDQGSASIQQTPGLPVVLLIRQPDARWYALDGPFTWPESPETRTVDLRWRRTVRVQLPASLHDEPAPAWIDGRDAADGWPRCSRTEATKQWECVGVLLDAGGVLLFGHAPRFGYIWIASDAATPLPIAIRTVAWAQLVRVGVDGGARTTAPLSVVAQRPVTSRWRNGTARTILAPDPHIRAERLSGELFWVTGRSTDTLGRVLQISGTGLATVRVPVDDWVASSHPSVPFDVRVAPAADVRGEVVTRDGRPAPGTRIAVSELLPPESGGGGTRGAAKPLRIRRQVAETQADADGAFSLDGLAPGDEYEFLALHPSLGRTKQQVTIEDGPVVLRLATPALVRGRVVRRGKPVGGVPVELTPLLEVVAMASDVFDAANGATVTAADGTFTLAIPASYSADLRVGDSQRGVLRRTVTSGPGGGVLDVGDLELPGRVLLKLYLPGGDPCHVYATGPVGAAGVTIVRATYAAEGVRQFLLPESGSWFLGAMCGAKEIALAPPIVTVPHGATEFAVRAELPPQ